MSAAAMGKAAEDGSPGTTILRPRISGWPVSDTARPSLVCSTFSVAPKPFSISSVWSRVGSGSITVVMPGVLRPASRMADFTCAEATGSV